MISADRNKTEENRERNATLDLIRIIAFFCVVSVHFFLYTGFYSSPVIGSRMFLMVCSKGFFMICVPLFVILSGYLEKDKILCKSYFMKITKVIGIYILASIAVFLFKVFYLHQNLRIKDLFFGILNFSMADYAWYIEMYIGLFLLIPFLNIVYRSLNKKQEKQCLILILCFITALPGMINVYIFSEAGWWLNPSQSGSFQKIIPGWWVGIWPITYYVIGCYIKEYSIRMKKSFNILCIVIVTLLYGVYCYWRSRGVNYIWGDWQGWGAFPILLLSALVFVFLVNIKMDACPGWCKSILKHCSNACLGAYLVSYIFDNLLYAKFSIWMPEMSSGLSCFFIVVGSVFLCSMLLSLVLSVVYNCFVKIACIFGQLWNRKQN